MKLSEAADAITSRFKEVITATNEFRGELTITVAPHALREVGKFCHDELNFELLLDISSVDNYDYEPRFEVVYELYSIVDGIHLRLKTTAMENEPSVPSVCDVWPGANWHEREVWDLMGIRFEGHPDLRRIIMWEGYPYHPLRKDFPIEGKLSEVPDGTFSDVAPLGGGPFVTIPASTNAKNREPRARSTEVAVHTEDFPQEP